MKAFEYPHPMEGWFGFGAARWGQLALPFRAQLATLMATYSSLTPKSLPPITDFPFRHSKF